LMCRVKTAKDVALDTIIRLQRHGMKTAYSRPQPQMEQQSLEMHIVI